MNDNLDRIAQRFSSHYPVMEEPSLRRIKGLKVVSILKEALQDRVPDVLLDIGCSNAFLLDVVVENLKPTLSIGIDLDARVIPRPTAQRIALLGTAMDLPFATNSIDVVICNHTYEHVPNAQRLFEEIRRVLKVGGIVYFSAMNARWPIEPHFHLPFIHWLPRGLSKQVMRLFGHPAGYLEQPLGISRLRELVAGFDITDYTLKVISQPEKYFAQDLIRKSRFHWLYPKIAKLLYGFLPGYLWILMKRSGSC